MSLERALVEYLGMDTAKKMIKQWCNEDDSPESKKWREGLNKGQSLLVDLWDERINGAGQRL